MKWLSRYPDIMAKKSLPARGAWIEIVEADVVITPGDSRSPHGEHGLKCVWDSLSHIRPKSLPARGAWIEIVDSAIPFGKREVAPRTGSMD